MTEPTHESVLLKNALVLDYLPVKLRANPAPRVQKADLRVKGERIVERGTGLQPAQGELCLDLNGRTVMPGLINAHHHLYSTLAPGMPAPANTPRNFHDVLTEIWWKLDRVLDADAVYMSAVSGAWDALRCGTTLVFDHHSSLTAVGGSLDWIEKALDEIGMRGCLCYETTDRGGLGSRDMCLAENRRYIEKHKQPAAGVPRFKGLLGAHANFTLEERTLVRLAEICDELDVGVHMHLAEGTTDRDICRERGWPEPVRRLIDLGLLRRGTLLAHGIDLTPTELQTIEEKGAWIVHNGRSNMNNGVGRAPVDRFPARSCIGTDGLDGNMWGELRTTFYRGNETGRGPLGFSGATKLWIGNYQMAREIFGEPFGSLDAGAPADFLICQSDQKTPLHADNWLSMIIFGFHPWDISEVWVGGRRRYTRGDAAPYDGAACRAAAQRIWDGMQKL